MMGAKSAPKKSKKYPAAGVGEQWRVDVRCGTLVRSWEKVEDAEVERLAMKSKARLRFSNSKHSSHFISSTVMQDNSPGDPLHVSQESLAWC